MSFKDLLVYVDATPSGAQRLEVAAALAGRHGAHLKGLHVLTRGYYESRHESLMREAEAAAELFARRTAQAGLSAEWCQIGYQLLGATVTDAMVRHGHCADLLIVGQPGEGSPVGVPADLAQRLVLTVGRPVLVVPYAGQFDAAGTKVLVALTAGRAATRAVHDALPLLRQAQQVTLLEVVSGSSVKEAGGELCPGILDHLGRHGVSVTLERQPAAGLPVADVLLNRAYSDGFDLLVMGAHAVPPFIGVGLGPVADQILRQMTLPVLMAH
jgi:nucleotide-binding universal stress UspA family protein